jgi:hypothetical protein
MGATQSVTPSPKNVPVTIVNTIGYTVYVSTDNKKTTLPVDNNTNADLLNVCEECDVNIYNKENKLIMTVKGSELHESGNIIQVKPYSNVIHTKSDS